MVLMDEYSRFPIVEVLNSINAKTVIPALDKISSFTGRPNIHKSDNGPPFDSHTFKEFAEYLGFAHRKITPRHPESNAQCERFIMRKLQALVKSYGRRIRNIHVEDRTCMCF